MGGRGRERKINGGRESGINACAAAGTKYLRPPVGRHSQHQAGGDPKKPNVALPSSTDVSAETQNSNTSVCQKSHIGRIKPKPQLKFSSPFSVCRSELQDAKHG